MKGKTPAERTDRRAETPQELARRAIELAEKKASQDEVRDLLKAKAEGAESDG